MAYSVLHDERRPDVAGEGDQWKLAHDDGALRCPWGCPWWPPGSSPDRGGSAAALPAQQCVDHMNVAVTNT